MKKALLFAVAAVILLHAASALAKPSVKLPAFYSDRYLSYQARNPGLSDADIRLALNLKLDEASYQNVEIVQNPNSLQVFVSKHYALPKGYLPDFLVAVDRDYAMRGVQLHADCCKAFLEMAHAMEREGLRPYIKSGYRMNKSNTNPDDMWNAWPGHSEHQTGLAFDLCLKHVTYDTMWEYKYHKTAEYAWLMEHAAEYGFILSYPKGQESITGFHFEPWHWRFVGTEVALDMKQKNICTYPEYWACYLMEEAKQPDPGAVLHCNPRPYLGAAYTGIRYALDR